MIIYGLLIMNFIAQDDIFAYFFIDIIGYVIDDELTVKPGTPLNMEISLDQKSKDIYGLLVSNMRVTDTRDQEENLIING